MKKEEYFRKMASLLMQIKAVADNYEEGCEYLCMCINDGHLSFHNNMDNENHYHFWFEAGTDFENGKILVDDCCSWIEKCEH